MGLAGGAGTGGGRLRSAGNEWLDEDDVTRVSHCQSMACCFQLHPVRFESVCDILGRRYFQSGGRSDSAEVRRPSLSIYEPEHGKRRRGDIAERSLDEGHYRAQDRVKSKVRLMNHGLAEPQKLAHSEQSSEQGRTRWPSVLSVGLLCG
jgi:hypothetical protein